jgi:hypothetical protein
MLTDSAESPSPSPSHIGRIKRRGAHRVSPAESRHRHGTSAESTAAMLTPIPRNRAIAIRDRPYHRAATHPDSAESRRGHRTAAESTAAMLTAIPRNRAITIGYRPHLLWRLWIDPFVAPAWIHPGGGPACGARAGLGWPGLGWAGWRSRSPTSPTVSRPSATRGAAPSRCVTAAPPRPRSDALCPATPEG